MTGPAAADEAYMSQALSLAERGRGTSHPNPVVGAVIVRKGDVLARGFHRRAGLPHAEIVALTRLGMRAPGATLYVTLEPCCHSGTITQAVVANIANPDHPSLRTTAKPRCSVTMRRPTTSGSTGSRRTA